MTFPKKMGYVITVASLALALWAPGRARAGSVEDTYNKIINDLGYMLIDGPVYLSSRLPVQLQGGNFLASMELAGYKNFGFGVSITSGLFTSFDKLDDNFQLIPKEFPAVVPMPGINLAVRWGIIRNLDIGVQVSFFPEIDTKYKDIIIAGANINVAVQARYRIVEGSGAKPDLVAQLGFAYQSGYLKVGKDYSFDFDETIEGTRVAGNLSMSGAPILGWDLYQLTPALVARWKLAWFRPYIGVALDLTFGHVDSGLDVELSLTVTHPNPGSYSESLTETTASMPPRVFGVRPIIGFEFALTQRLKLVLQGDLGFYVRQHPGDMKNPGLEKGARKEVPDSLYVQTIDGEPLFPFVFAAGLGVRYDYH